MNYIMVKVEGRKPYANEGFTMLFALEETPQRGKRKSKPLTVMNRFKTTCVRTSAGQITCSYEGEQSRSKTDTIQISAM